MARSLFRTISKNKIEDLKDILHSFFAGISYEFYRKNELDKYEGYYASIVYALFNGAGLDVSSQVTSNKGRVDLTVKYKDRVYLIEFEVVDKDSEGKALEQIKDKKYYEQFIGKFKEIYLIGIEFSKLERNIVGFELKKVH